LPVAFEGVNTGSMPPACFVLQCLWIGVGTSFSQGLGPVQVSQLLWVVKAGGDDRGRGFRWHSTLGSRVIMKKAEEDTGSMPPACFALQCLVIRVDRDPLRAVHL